MSEPVNHIRQFCGCGHFRSDHDGWGCVKCNCEKARDHYEFQSPTGAPGRPATQG